MSTPSKGLRAPQASVIDKHEHRAAMLKDIENERGSEKAIARRYGLAVTTIRQLKMRMFKELIEEKRRGRDLKTAEGIMAKLGEQVEKVAKITEAMEAYLADPDDPTKLYMGLQAEDVVAHYEQDTGEVRKDGSVITKRKKTQLSELIKRFEDTGKSSFEFTIKRDDTRRLYHDAIRLNLEIMDRFAKIQGLMPNVNVNITRTEVAQYFFADLRVALESFPGAIEAVTAKFEEKAEETPDG
jgi:hypothetical protein